MSVFKVSTTQSLSRYLNHCTCWIQHTQRHILFLFDPTFSLPVVSLSYHQAVAESHNIFFSFNFAFISSLSLHCLHTPQRAWEIYPTQKPVRGIQFLPGTIEEVCESSPHKCIEPLITKHLAINNSFWSYSNSFPNNLLSSIELVTKQIFQPCNAQSGERVETRQRRERSDLGKAGSVWSPSVHYVFINKLS